MATRARKELRERAAVRAEQIYAAAARLFVERGFAATSMSDIAEAVGITKAGLYYFVDSKDDMLFNLMTWSMDTLDEEVTRPSLEIDDPLDRLQALIAAHLRNIGTRNIGSGNPLTVIMDEPAGLSAERRSAVGARKAAYFHVIRDCMEALAADGRLRDVDPTVAAFSVIGQVVWLGRWYRPDGKISLDAIVSDMTDIALTGVIKNSVMAARAMRKQQRTAKH